MSDLPKWKLKSSLDSHNLRNVWERISVEETSLGEPVKTVLTINGWLCHNFSKATRTIFDIDAGMLVKSPYNPKEMLSSTGGSRKGCSISHSEGDVFAVSSEQLFDIFRGHFSVNLSERVLLDYLVKAGVKDMRDMSILEEVEVCLPLRRVKT